MKQVELKIEYLPIDALQPYERNTRHHSNEDIDIIAKSIEKYSMSDPIGIWSDHNVVVEGHGRLEACKKLGYTQVPVIRLDHLTDEERREYGILHNWSAEQSDWDFKQLEEEVKELDFEDFDLGFDFDTDTEDAVDDEFEVEVPEEAASRLGQVYQLGRHRLMVGDSTKEEDVEKLCNGQLVDMLLTDPPYMVDYHGTAGKIQNDNLNDEAALDFLRDAFTNADSVMKPGAVFYIWHADSKGAIFRNACELVGWEVRQCLI